MANLYWLGYFQKLDAVDRFYSPSLGQQIPENSQVVRHGEKEKMSEVLKF